REVPGELHRSGQTGPEGRTPMNRGAAIGVTALVTALFAVFFLYPALSVIGEAFRMPGGGLTLDFIAGVFRNPVYREGLWNALALGLVSTIATFLLAFP